MPPLTLIIGTGISATAYLASANRYLGQIAVLGGPDLWNQVDPHHRMGQPRPLLTGNLLGGGPADRGFQERPRPGRHFMLARDFAWLVQDQLQRHANAVVPASYVTGITRLANRRYRVEFNAGHGAYVAQCDHVIIATGAGPARALMAGEDGRLEVDVNGMEGYVVGGNDFMAPGWTMPQGADPAGAHVAVYGGSATAAWVVELAAMRGMNVVCWFTRPGRDTDPNRWSVDARFEAAFPPGARNVRVELDYRAHRFVLRLVGVELRRPRQGRPFVGLRFRDQQGHAVRRAVDLLVYALGTQHTRDAGIRAMLDANLQRDLVAYYDRNLAISATPSLLAVGTEDGTLMIVGSAMSSMAGFGGQELTLQGDPLRRLATLASYADISATLPPAARPTEGIAMVMAGIEALNDYIPARPARGGRLAHYITPTYTTAQPTGRGQPPPGLANPYGSQTRLHAIDFEWDINFNTSNRTQLAAYLAQSTDLEPFAANLAVALIVHLRTRDQNVLGLSDPQVAAILDTADRYVQTLTRLNPQLDATRWLNDVLLGPDYYVGQCVEFLTTDPGWVQYWRQHQINC